MDKFLIRRVADRYQAVEDRFRSRPRAPLDRWGLRRLTDGRVICGSAILDDLASRFGSPLIVVDGDRLEHRLRSMVASLPSVALMTRCAPNPLFAVLEAHHRHGFGVVVGSGPEFDLARAMGWRDVFLVEPVPDRSTIERAAESRATVLVESELVADQVAAARVTSVAVSSGGDLPLPVGVEVCRSVGVEPTTLWLRGGLHDEVRSTDVRGIVEDSGWTPQRIIVSLEFDSVPRLSELAQRLSSALAIDPSPRRGPGLDATLNAAVEQLSVDFDCPVAVDVGAAVTSSYQMLLATVLDTKLADEPPHVVLDAGINLLPDLLTREHHVVNVSRRSDRALPPVRLVGPICTPADVVFANARLNPIERDDVVAVLQTGDGLLGASTSFSFPQPAAVWLSADRGAELVRRAERFDDLIAFDRPARPSTPMS